MLFRNKRACCVTHREALMQRWPFKCANTSHTTRFIDSARPLMRIQLIFQKLIHKIYCYPLPASFHNVFILLRLNQQLSRTYRESLVWMWAYAGKVPIRYFSLLLVVKWGNLCNVLKYRTYVGYIELNGLIKMYENTRY
jgi:hypothetical protein